MPNERISEVETKVFTHEGRIKNNEQDLRQVEDNIDRIESHLLEMNSRPFPIGAVISGIIGFLGVMGSSIFGVLNYVDSQIESQYNSNSAYEQRVRENSDDIKDLTSMIHDRVGRLEERVSSQGRDISDLEKHNTSR